MEIILSVGSKKDTKQILDRRRKEIKVTILLKVKTNTYG
jgi:hypothetical protein